jgi:DNA-binding FrmR family transcriptional regulator
MNMSPEDKVATLRRLKSIEGHVRGIARMIDEDVYCIEVIQQIRAVQAALDKVANLTLRDHLDHCVVSAVRGDDPDERQRVMNEMLTVFEARSR